MVDPASIKYALIYEHINQGLGVDQIITNHLSIYLTTSLCVIYDLDDDENIDFPKYLAQIF